METDRSSTHFGAKLLLLQCFTHQMTLIAFNIVHDHVGPAWTHNGCLYESHFIFVNDVSCVAPEIVIRKTYADIEQSSTQHHHSDTKLQKQKKYSTDLKCNQASSHIMEHHDFRYLNPTR